MAAAVSLEDGHPKVDLGKRVRRIRLTEVTRRTPSPLAEADASEREG